MTESTTHAGTEHYPQQLTWDPYIVCADLTAKLAARSRHVNFFMGAGTSRAAGLPDVVTLLGLVLKDIPAALRPATDALFAERNLEEGLSRLRRLRTLLEGEQEFDGLTAQSALELDNCITQSIVKHLSIKSSSTKAHEDFASWLVGDYYTRPIEVFTVNYDLLIKHALEKVGASYADGFVGNLQAGFRADLVESTSSPEDSYPSSFARLWKLHGSLNWLVSDQGKVVRTGALVGADHVAAIYPSDEKYDESRRVPYTVLQDRFRRALAVPESITIISGYSFGDQHLNEIIFDAGRRYPRSEIVALCYSTIYESLQVTRLPNLSVYAASEAIIGGELRPWHADAGTAATIWDSDRFQPGDFTKLAAYLSKSSRVDQWRESAHGGNLV